MEFRDIVNNMYGRLEIYKKFSNGTQEKIYQGNNAITYRGKLIMSRLLMGGLLPNSTPTYAGGLARVYNYGSVGTDQMRVTGMAFGNGGHLIYNNSTNVTNVLPKSTSTVLNSLSISHDYSRPAMPYISGTNWGYALQTDRTIPGVLYEPVENGNVPWDGTANIYDNSVGVIEPNTTLYSETFRIPLDDVTPAVDGYSTPTNTEVQFKATIPQIYLNYTGNWGFAQQKANIISEAGLIVGYRPDFANLNTGQIYSYDGAEPGSGTAYNLTNFGYDTGVAWTSKDGSTSDAYTGVATKTLATCGSVPPTVVNGVDTWPSGNNSWNIIARKTFPGVPKFSSFALVFVWTIGF